MFINCQPIISLIQLSFFSDSLLKSSSSRAASVRSIWVRRGSVLSQSFSQLHESQGLLLLVLATGVLFDDKLLGHLKEGLINIRACLCTRLYNLQLILLLKLLNVSLRHLGLFLDIWLVGQDSDLYILPWMLLYLLHPWCHIQERLLKTINWALMLMRECYFVCQIENDYDSICSLVIGICDSPVSLLPSCVPLNIRD